MNRWPARIRDLPRLAGSATAMYLAALAMSGLAIVITVALPPHQRGLLVATTTSATIGVAVGGLSLDTFLLAQGRPWLEELAGRRSLALYVATLPLAALLSWVFAEYSAQASPAVAAVGGACIAASNLPAAAGLTAGRFRAVYQCRALFAAVAPVLYLVLLVLSVRTAASWLLAWLGTQALMAVAMWSQHGARLVPLFRRASTQPERLTRLGLTHTGAVAQIFTYRFDQLALSRYQGPDALAVYSLAMTAIEFAQAGAVVQAQRALGDHAEGSADRLRGLLRKAAYLAAGMGVLVLVGLAGIGAVARAYRGAFLLGLLLLPRSIAVALGKVLSARLVNLGRERATAVIALVTAVAAVVAYSLVAAPFGTAGVALVSVVLFGSHATASAAALRGRSAPGTRTDSGPVAAGSGVGGHA